MGTIIMRFVVLLVDTHYDTSTALAMFRYNCDALDFIEKQQRIMGDSNMEFTIEPLEPGLHTIATGPDVTLKHDPEAYDFADDSPYS